MIRKSARFLSMWILLLGLLACAGNPGDGNPGGGGLTPTPPVPVFGDFILGVATTTPIGPSNAKFSKSLAFAGGGINVLETRNTVSDIAFEADNQANNDVEFPGVFVVELIHQGAEVNQEFPGFGITQIPFDTYRKFKMSFEKLDSEDIPQELLPDPLVAQLLLDRTFVVTGTFQEAVGKDVDGDGRIGSVPFQILSDNQVEIEVSSPNFFTVSPDKTNFFFIAFQIDAWFNGLLPQLQSLTPSDLTGGVAVIRKEISNNKIAQILDDFESNTERSCKSAPSEDGNFDEDDVDGESGSEPL
ncbi:MAG: hypothetical protein K8R69_11035 [Deltaproteobacteria bacterium]|nr:hypothetical protein [Deltaproteobacteria bacterium]